MELIGNSYLGWSKTHLSHWKFHGFGDEVPSLMLKFMVLMLESQFFMVIYAFSLDKIGKTMINHI